MRLSPPDNQVSEEFGRSVQTHLFTEEEHHIAIRRGVGVGSEQMGEEILIFQLGVGQKVVLRSADVDTREGSPLYIPSW